MIPQTRLARIRPEAAQSASTESLAGSQPAVRPLGGARRSWQPMRTHLELQRPSFCETPRPVHSTSRRARRPETPWWFAFQKARESGRGTVRSVVYTLNTAHPIIIHWRRSGVEYAIT